MEKLVGVLFLIFYISAFIYYLLLDDVPDNSKLGKWIERNKKYKKLFFIFTLVSLFLTFITFILSL